jgi:hypothetical protein
MGIAGAPPTLRVPYGVQTKVLVQAIKRNPERFPDDFMFQLRMEEWEALRSQFVTSNGGRGGWRYAPYAFTEQGVAMLSSVLNSPRHRGQHRHHAGVRAHARGVRLEQGAGEEVRGIGAKLQTHDQAIAGIMHAIRQLMVPSEKPKRPIGFVAPQEKKSYLSGAPHIEVGEV